MESKRNSTSQVPATGPGFSHWHTVRAQVSTFIINITDSGPPARYKTKEENNKRIQRPKSLQCHLPNTVLRHFGGPQSQYGPQSNERARRAGESVACTERVAWSRIITVINHSALCTLGPRLTDEASSLSNRTPRSKPYAERS